MSLRDAHLQQALKHAPDYDVAPDAATRREVLNYAAKAARKKSALFGLRALWQSMSGWPLAGLSSAMAVMLVMVIFWDKHAAQTTFDDVASRQEAQVERKVAQAENKAVPVSAAPAAAGAAQVTVETAPEVVADSSSIAAAPNKAKMAAQRQVTSLSKQLKMPVTAAPAVDVAPPLAAVNQPEVAAAQAPSPSSRKMENAEASAGRGGDMKKLDAEKSASGPAQQMDEIADARSRGAANAAADIKVGNLRILTLAIKSEAVDSATGYRIEVVANRPETAALQAELESYNQAMRDWYAKSIQN